MMMQCLNNTLCITDTGSACAHKEVSRCKSPPLAVMRNRGYVLTSYSHDTTPLTPTGQLNKLTLAEMRGAFLCQI